MSITKSVPLKSYSSKEGLVEFATVCVKSEVILTYLYLLNKESRKNFVKLFDEK